MQKKQKKLKYLYGTSKATNVTLLTTIKTAEKALQTAFKQPKLVLRSNMYRIFEFCNNPKVYLSKKTA